MEVNAEVIYQCMHCDYQSITKGHLAQHKRAVHEGVKYLCGQCNHQAPLKGNLTQPKRAVHKIRVQLDKNFVDTINNKKKTGYTVKKTKNRINK